MFADINGRASIFPAKSEPLNNTQTNDDDWRSGTDRRFGRNEANGRRSQAHERDGHEERRSEEHTSELQSLMRISYAVFCLKKKKTHNTQYRQTYKLI